MNVDGNIVCNSKDLKITYVTIQENGNINYGTVII